MLSGAAVNAGVIGLIRFMPPETALPDWGGVLAAAGLLSAFYGVAIGITQSNPKTVLAYSSVSQMGVIATVIGMGLATGDGGAAIGAASTRPITSWSRARLFLALGAVTARERAPPVAGAGSGRDHRARARRTALYRRRAGEGGR